MLTPETRREAAPSQQGRSSVQESDPTESIAALEQQIALLTQHLAQAQNVVQQWTDVNASLSQSAAEARATNQGKGRGIMGSLFGSAYRGAMRRAAASSNAEIAKEVADRRAKIAEGKREAQESVRQIQSVLTSAKQALKALTSDEKARSRSKSAATKATVDPFDLLDKLKQAHDAGLLTDAEYEDKRRNLVSAI